MSEKRYFKKEYEEEYYIFDSEKISEKDFDERYEYDGYVAFEDSMQGDELVELLNEQQATIQSLQSDLKECRARKRIIADKLKLYQDIAKKHNCISSTQLNGLIEKLQDLCGESDYENAKLKIENKELQKKVDWLCEVFDYGSDESIKVVRQKSEK